jgi:hypothetical protein
MPAWPGSICLPRAAFGPRAWRHSRRSGGLGHRRAPGFQGPSGGRGQRREGALGVGRQVRRLPRGVRRFQRDVQSHRRRHHRRRDQNRPCLQAQGRHGRAHHPDEGGDGFHAVRLHQPRHAVEPTEVAHYRRGLCGDGFLLYLAEVVPESFTLSNQSITEVQKRMPNRNRQAAQARRLAPRQ